jgi:uncharacterized protein (TIGR02001 family)
VPPALFHKAPWALGLLAFSLSGPAPVRADVPTPIAGLSAGGGVAVTSDYIYRGVSESDGHGAVQADAHLSSAGGSFLGLWASSRDQDLEPGASALLDLYLGHRFDLSPNWSLTASGRARYYLGSNGYEPSADYQEISLALGYLDSWSFSVTAIPSAVRYWMYQRLSRAPAWVTDTSGQYLVGEHVFLTAGVGYYYSTGTGTGIERATGYAFGNLGAAYEHDAWRLDVGYFMTQNAASRSFPYPIASHQFAATLAWHF